MIILGIDPGTAITGFGVVQHTANRFRVLDYGCIRTSAKDSLAVRLEQLHGNVCGLVETYRPDCCAVEQLFFNKNIRTALAVGHARGVILLAAAQKGLPVYEYTPLQVKQAVVGYGRADKRQVQQMVKTFLNLDALPRPDDAADALAIGICHGHSHAVLNLTGAKGVRR